MPLCQLFEALDRLVPNWRLVKSCENAKGVDKGGYFGGSVGVPFEIEDAFADLDEEVVVIVHLLDDFDEVGDEFFLDPRVTWMRKNVPRTAPMRDIFPAALSLS